MIYAFERVVGTRKNRPIVIAVEKVATRKWEVKRICNGISEWSETYPTRREAIAEARIAADWWEEKTVEAENYKQKIACLRKAWGGPIRHRKGTGMAIAGTYAEWLEIQLVLARERPTDEATENL